MTKSEFTWSVLRIMGLSLLLLGSYLGFTTMGWRSTASGVRYSVPIPPLALTVIGLYFLFFGRSVFWLLMREAPVQLATRLRRQPHEPGDPRTTLTRMEQIDFTAWLQARPDLQSKPEDDQLALYRDHQKAGPGGLR